MVVFTCGYCGESVQKPKVEKHYTTTKCRNRNPNLSCMDCFKDFLGNAYEEHTKCITEEERYSGKGFVAKEKKGERKQSTWIDLVQSVLDEQKNAPRNVLRIIETISKHNNTPRKKPKFFNFVKNVCGAKTGAKEIEQAWELISPKLTALSNADQKSNQTNDAKSNGTEENGHDTENQNNHDESSQNSQDETNNTDETNKNGLENGEENSEDQPLKDKKLSKKQRKEEKKRQKYEAELQSAEAPPEEDDEEEDSKKGKKKKNRAESISEELQEGKKNKRKRQDTVNSVSSNQELTETNGTGTEVPNGTVKTQKKKPKVDEELEESMCLHDQNVAKISELAMTDKFNWHAVIMSVLQKKGNELPFKRLQKKVLAEYSESTGREIDDRIADKFIKKLKSAPKVRVDKNRVTLLD